MYDKNSSHRYYEKHKEEILARKHAYRKAHPVEQRAKENSYYWSHKEHRDAYDKKYREKNVERLEEYRLAHRQERKERERLRQYGVTPEQFNAMVLQQNNKCKVCGKEMDQYNEPCLDHNHKTLAIRGLLCKLCNVGIGNFLDNPESLIRAARYVEADGNIENYDCDPRRS